MPQDYNTSTMNPVTRETIFQRATDAALYAGSLISGYKSRQMFASNNPYNGSCIGQIEDGNALTVDTAVSEARKSFNAGDWAKKPPEERKKILLQWVALLEIHAEELAALDCVDAGKPITECLNTDIPETIKTIAWYAQAIDKIFGRIAPTSENILALIRKEPAGVVGTVLPWNFPSLMYAWKVAPALAAGNSVVVKPAEQTSLSAYRMTQLAHQAGVPVGALTLVTGMGSTAGKALGLHSDVDVVSFTGSTEVGRLFLQYSAQSNLKKIVLECGGKSPQIIFADAYSLETIANDILGAAFWNMGENCSCGSRLLVHNSLKEKLLRILVAKIPEWIVGNPTNPTTQIGPMIEREHFEKVRGYLATAKAEGAKLICGGGTPNLGAGLFVEPTIFDNVTEDMSIFQEEIFGPILAITTFDSEAEAISLANNTEYGLAASFYTADVRRAHRVSMALRAGTVSVNCFSEGSIATPFGGYKLSGFGGQDNGLEAFEQYLETKTVWYEN